jgi:hypothetical protein
MASTATEGNSTVTSGVPRSGSSWLEDAIEAVDRNWPWALAGLMLAEFLLLLYMGRGLSFFYDDWNYVTQDYGGGIHSLLTSHNGHLSVIPIAIYKVLFHVVGLNHYAVFRLVVIVLHLICGGLVFVLAARRIPRVPALLATALILFLGAAWEDLLWAFQMSYLLSVAGGLGAWVLLERDDLRSKSAAMLCLIVALGSSSLGIAIVIGVAAELAWGRRWRTAWVVVVPVLLYAIWYLHYGEDEITKNGLINAPGFVEELAAAAFGGLVGRALEWGRPLAVLGFLVLLLRLARPLPVSARLVGLLATGFSLWFITAAARSTVSQPETSRYIYLGAVVIVLVAVELLRGVTITPRATGLATLVVGFCAVTGLTALHAGAMGLQEHSKTVTAELGALELAAAHAPPGYQPDTVLAPQIMAGSYLHTVRAIGSSPADTPAEIVAANPASRAAADRVLLALEAPGSQPLGGVRSSPLAPAPAISSLIGGLESQSGGCISLAPSIGALMTAAFTLPAGGVVIHNQGSAPASLALRRFGEVFDQIPSQAGPHSVAVLSPPSDATQVPWQLQVASASRFSICGLLP